MSDAFELDNQKFELKGHISSNSKITGRVTEGSGIKGTLASPCALTGRVTIGSIIEGVSPIVSITKIDGGYELTVVDINGMKTVTILNGVDGQDGPPGEIDDDLVAELVSEYLTENPPVAQVNNVIEF
jgi:hypothetical protein